MAENILFRTRVPAKRLKNAEKILRNLGLKPGDAFNMLLAQIELRKGLPFSVTLDETPLVSPERQAELWNQALGAY
jgi:addiction module RelB/DinJ family antitoxin